MYLLATDQRYRRTQQTDKFPIPIVLFCGLTHGNDMETYIKNYKHGQTFIVRLSDLHYLYMLQFYHFLSCIRLRLLF